ncbi:MAG: CHAT domain-containing protein [Saprospiraceae bacterium]|nr:CHAT domain-containing protein [Saprospiraceae bacterium]
MRILLTFCYTLFLFLQGIAQNSQYSRPQLDSLYILGLELFKTGQNTQSAEILLTACKAFNLQNHQDSILYGNILHYLGSDYIALKKNDDAWHYLTQALNLRYIVPGPSHPDYAKTLNNISNLAMNMDKLDEAESYVIQALIIKARNPGKDNGLDYSKSQSILTQILLRKGKYEQADSVATDYILRIERFVDTSSWPYARAISLQAAVKTRLYDIESAKNLYDRALYITKRTGENTPEYLSVLLNIGQIYAKSGLHAAAEKQQQAAVDLALNLRGKNSEEYVLALSNLGYILLHQGRVNQALPILHESRKLAESVFGLHNTETLRIIGNLGSAYYYLGDFSRAKPLLEEHWQLIETTQRRDEEYFNAMHNYARLLHTLRDYTSAEHLYLRSENEYNQASPAKFIALHSNLGQLYIDMGRLDQAEVRLKKSLQQMEADNSRFTAQHLSVFSDLVYISYLKKDTFGILQYAQKGLNYLQNRLPADISFLSETELYDVSNFAFDQYNRYFEIAKAINEPQLNTICLEYQLFVKNFVLDYTKAIRQKANETNDKSKRAAWTSASRRYAAAIDNTTDPKKIESLRANFNAQEKQLLGTIKIERTASLQAIINALKTDEACIEFVRYNDDKGQFSYLAFVITSTNATPSLVDLGKESIFESLTGQGAFPFADNYGKSGQTDLFKQLIAPLLPHLTGIKTIWCSATGLLHEINPSAISMPNGNICGDRFHFHLISNNSSLVSRSKPRFTSPTHAVLAGAVDYGKKISNLAIPAEPLPYARGTMQTAKRLLETAGAAVSFLSDTSATEINITKACATTDVVDCINFFSHAYYHRDSSIQEPHLSGMSNPIPYRPNPLEYVGIIVSNANNFLSRNKEIMDNGLLNGIEISQLNLKNNQLAFVTACSTAKGDIASNEGIWGLARAFRLAGSQYIILTLWPVRDDHASFFVESFYQHWLAEKRNIPEAFEAAQREAMIRNPDPHYWAGFVLWE